MIFLMLLILIPADPATPKTPPSPIVAGIYYVSGTAGGGVYESVATLKPLNDAWLVIYQTGLRSVVGVGIVHGGRLAVGWSDGDVRGVTVYEIATDGQLLGKWTSGEKVYSERLELLKPLK